MFILSVKLTKPRIVAICICFLSIIIAGAAILGSQPKLETVKQITAVKATTDEERISFLKTYGWEVKAEPVEIMEVIIPAEFDEIYEKYNIIQKSQGYDLSKFKGKRAKRYTYIIINYPDATDEIRANILSVDGIVVGGDVCSVVLGGFIHGFEK